jgi:hypothetical protein
MGGALRKGTLRTLGAVVGGGLGLGALAVADEISGHDWNFYDSKGNGLAPAAIIVCVCLLGFLIVVHRQRFRQVDHFFFVMLYTVPVVVGSAIRCGGCLR